MPLLKPCTVDGALQSQVAPVQSVAWGAIATPNGTLFANSAAYSAGRAVRSSANPLSPLSCLMAGFDQRGLESCLAGSVPDLQETYQIWESLDHCQSCCCL